MTDLSQNAVTLENQPEAPHSSAETPALLASVGVHLGLLLLFGWLTVPGTRPTGVFTITSDRTLDSIELPLVVHEFQVRDEAAPQPGNDGVKDARDAAALAMQLAEVSSVPPDLTVMTAAQMTIDPTPVQSWGATQSDTVQLKGSGGTAATGAAGAIDRLTQEILLSLEQRPTLVVWLLDQSGSLTRQRQEIGRRLDQIYDELGSIRSLGSEAFRRPVEPLLSSVIAFGERISLLTQEPTSDVAELRAAVRSIPPDESGIENVFAAVDLAVDRSEKYRRGSARQPARNVMLIIFSDEVGDDPQLLDRTVDRCRQWAIPVYVVGVPAPFGCRESLVKWVDPDPRYDQSPRWGRVNQGPESLLPERLQLQFVHPDPSLDRLDSGFGPFALTRLCVETGGIYFTVHPNRRTDGAVAAWETEPYAAHLSHFYSPRVMRKYRPDYISTAEYYQRLRQSTARAALVKAAQQSLLEPLQNPRRRFVMRTEAEFARELTEAQKEAARLQPQIDGLLQILLQGESDRAREESPRWQAGFDLALGRTLALKVRTETYNIMLAAAKGGLKPQEARNNTWTLRSSQQITAGSRWQQIADQARSLLEQVQSEHPNTPWALLAEKELETPFGWQWSDSYTELAPPPAQVAGNNNPRRPRDERRQMQPPPKPSRPIPKL